MRYPKEKVMIGSRKRGPIIDATDDNDKENGDGNVAKKRATLCDTSRLIYERMLSFTEFDQ